MTTTRYRFRVAGFTFAAALPSAIGIDALLPSFRPFRESGDTEREDIFRFSSVESLPDVARTLLEETDNDMGHLRLFSTEAGYRVELIHDGHTHVMHTDSSFSAVEAQVSWQDKKAGDAVSSMLRVRKKKSNREKE